MPNLSRNASHPAATCRKPQSSRLRHATGANRRCMSTQPGNPAPPDSGQPAAVSPEFALASIGEEFARLQQLLAHPNHADLRKPVAHIARLCQNVEDTIAAASQNLARSCDGLQALVELLGSADECRLPASRLLGLLDPLHKQLARNWSQISQML